MGIFSKKEFNMIDGTFIETIHSRNLFNKHKLKSILINEDLYKVVDVKEYETESRFDATYGTLLKCGSKYILFNGIDMSNITFGELLRKLEHMNAMKYVIESLLKHDNIVAYFEEYETEENKTELRFIIFKFKEKNIAHLETVDLVRIILENALGDNELPDFPYIEVINHRVSRLLRLTK